MNLSRPFIQRPVATTLLTLALLLVGLAAWRQLPVSPLPQVDFPTIVVSANFPGANPETMAATVATPLERALGTIAGLTEITSSSSLGSTRVVLQFDLNRDINGAAREVQAAIRAAMPGLPSGMPNPPTYRKINPADAPIMILALTSETLTPGQMYDAAATVLAQKLSQVEGVGQANVGGSSLPAVRVDLNPVILNKLEVNSEQVRAAIVSTNSNRPKGALWDGERQWQIHANDRARTAADYRDLVVTWRNGAPVRLRDLGEVIDSVQDLRNSGSANGKPAVLITINRQPGANIVGTVERVTALLPQLREQIPTAIDLDIMLDRTPTIRASLHEMERTLMIAIGLVILVVFLFLRSARATLIPVVAVPVSLVSTFAVMYVCGYSLNNLSLMALIVATGFVVDDAIVVLENIMRHIEEGMAPKLAALRGAREVGFTVLAMSVALIAAFIPILLMGGVVGRLFREFAVTMVAAVTVSLVVSLTMTPMMCAYLMKRLPRDAHGKVRRGWLARAGEAMFNGVRAVYAWTLTGALRVGWLVLILLGGVIAYNVHLYNTIPKGFFPIQDTGRLVGFVRADQGTSFQAMQRKLARFVNIVRQDPAVENVTAFTGGGARNSGSMFVSLKPLAERGVSAEQVIARLRARTLREAGALLFLNPVQDLRIGGRQANAEYQFTLQSDDLDALRLWEPRIRLAMADIPGLLDVNTDEQDRGTQTTLTINRDAAARLGVNMRNIGTTLNNYFGQRPVSTIYNPLNQYRVVLEAAPRFWQSPEALRNVYVSVAGGDQIALTSFAEITTTNTPLSVSHQGQFAASTISFNLAEGMALSEATQQVQDTLARMGVPTTVQGRFQGTVNAFERAMSNQPLLILVALLTLYIILGILYESLIHPITIISTLPSAGIGALLALQYTETQFSLIAMIAIILLIGIVMKNAIMMIDFALVAQRERALDAFDAIREACILRFRPIIMTTLAALFGALPLALSPGEGAELRQPLGIAIVGGLLVSQVLTLYTTPVVYLYLDRLRAFFQRGRGARGEHPEPGGAGAARSANDRSVGLSGVSS